MDLKSKTLYTLIGVTGESLSPRILKPIFCSSDLKKLLFSRTRASFWVFGHLQGNKNSLNCSHINNEVQAVKVKMKFTKEKKFKSLLAPSSPRITFMAKIICSAAGGDIEVACRWAGQVYFKYWISSWRKIQVSTALNATQTSNSFYSTIYWQF